MNTDVRYCTPKPDTKIYAMVFPDWDNHNLDSAGNTKAAELVRQVGKKPLLNVTVTGYLNKDGIIHVSSLTLHETGSRR